MRKLILTAIMACVAFASGFAQTDSTEIKALREEMDQLRKEMNQEKSARKETERQKGIWDFKNKYSVFYGSQTLTNVDLGVKYKSQYNYGLDVALFNIRFHSKPIGRMVMIGMQLALSSNFAKQEKNVDYDYDAEISGGGNPGEELMKEELSSLMGGFDLMHMDCGVRFQPTVTVAPFATLGVKGLDALKVETGYGLIPSYTMLINDGDIVSGFGLYNSFHIGLAWKNFGIGYEHRWGSSDLKILDLLDQFNDDDDDDDYGVALATPTTLENTKQKHNQKANRLYVRLYF